MSPFGSVDEFAFNIFVIIPGWFSQHATVDSENHDNKSNRLFPVGISIVFVFLQKRITRPDECGKPHKCFLCKRKKWANRLAVMPKETGLASDTPGQARSVCNNSISFPSAQCSCIHSYPTLGRSHSGIPETPFPSHHSLLPMSPSVRRHCTRLVKVTVC